MVRIYEGFLGYNNRTGTTSVLSVSRQTAVDLLSPHIYSAGHTQRSGEALLLQPPGHLQTATAVMAVDHHIPVPVFLQLVQTILNLTHRQQCGPVNVYVIPLVLLAAVQQQKIVSGIQPVADTLTIDFNC